MRYERYLLVAKFVMDKNSDKIDKKYRSL